MTLWREVLAALADDSLDDGSREQVLARGAAHLDANRATQAEPASVEDVMRIAFEEFCLLLDSETARTALNESGPGTG
ncbi:MULTISPECIES: hypothetical protein [unclassified Streptomyces]|uniref:hypothetical protein n=1 Tax=unclassified Streptomyces TaxID=2593676 RepID=UPI003426E93D